MGNSNNADIIWATVASGILSGLLIVINEWIKVIREQRHTKKKYLLWLKIASHGGMGRSLEPEDARLTYELCKDGVAEMDLSGKAHVKGMKYPPCTGN